MTTEDEMVAIYGQRNFNDDIKFLKSEVRYLSCRCYKLEEIIENFNTNLEKKIKNVICEIIAHSIKVFVYGFLVFSIIRAIYKLL